VAARPLSLPRKLLYAAILALAGSLLVLVVLEGTLRLIGYGYSPHFARRETRPSGETLWRDNRWCTAAYFWPALVRRPLPFRLPEKKAARSYRIFVLGSSAAMGDPEPSFSFGRILESMLQAAYPEIHFEVVNAAITAINSHVVRDIAADCAKLEPDLFIVYEGHNEVIGPFGPGGVFAPFFQSEVAVRALAGLKRTRTGQLVGELSRRATGNDSAAREWGGMPMFLRQQIPADDPRLDAVREHFAANLRAIAESARAAGAHTLLCTVPVNLRDFAPFLSLHRPDLTDDERARWDAHYAAAQEAERNGDLAAADADYRAALALDDGYAELLFRAGRLALAQGRDDDARRLLSRAVDRDALRFRTDSTLNDTIRHLRRTLPDGTEVIDLVATLERESRAGLVGDDLLYEHVHLTFRGAYQVARTLFTQVSSDLARRRLIGDRIPEPFDYETVRIRLAYTAHEQAMIALELVNRFRVAPFTGQIDHAIRLAAWEQRATRATALLGRADALPALRELYRRALETAPDDWILARNAGAMFVARQAPAEAVPLLERARAWIDDDVDTLVPLGWALRALGRTAEADAVFARARELEPRYPNLPPQ